VSAECVICSSVIGDNIGGFYVGQHHKNAVYICEWCKMCMEDIL